MEIYNRDSSSVLTRRRFLQAGSAVVASIGCCGKIVGAVGDSSKKRITVGAHVWVYAARQPEYNVTPVLPQIFSDLKYAQINGVELMHNVLRKRETVERIGELSQKYELPVIGTSFSGPMWNRDKHEAVMEDAEIVIGHLAKLKGKTFGVSVGAAPQKKTAQQLDAQADLLCCFGSRVDSQECSLEVRPLDGQRHAEEIVRLVAFRDDLSGVSHNQQPVIAGGLADRDAHVQLMLGRSLEEAGRPGPATSSGPSSTGAERLPSTPTSTSGGDASSSTARVSPSRTRSTTG